MSLSPVAQSVLITGTSAGSIGSALAFAFANHGLLTFATSRDTSRLNKTLAVHPNVHVLELDVTSPISVHEAVASVLAETGGTLDYLVNNAGTGYKTDLVDANIDVGKQVFDVNLWGPLAVTQACTNALIKAKGTVVNISSVGGIVPTPWIGIYSASKAALTLMSETLRLELAPLGVSVLTAMAGAVAGTNFHQNLPNLTLPAFSPYKPIEQQIRDSGENDPKGTDQTAFAEQLVTDILKGKKGLLWRGQMASVTKWVSKFMPSKMLDGMLTNGRGTTLLQNIRSGGAVPSSVSPSYPFEATEPDSSISDTLSESTPDLPEESSFSVPAGRFGPLGIKRYKNVTEITAQDPAINPEARGKGPRLVQIP